MEAEAEAEAAFFSKLEAEAEAEAMKNLPLPDTLVQTVPVSIHIAWDLSICNIFLFICNIFCVYNLLLYFGPRYDVKLSISCFLPALTPFCFYNLLHKSLLLCPLS